MHVIIAPTFRQAVHHLEYNMPGVRRSNAVWRDAEGNSIKPIISPEALAGLTLERVILVNPNGFEPRTYREFAEIVSHRAPNLQIEVVND